MAGNDLPLKAVRRQIASAVDFIIQLDRTSDGQRVVAAISEVTGMEGDNLLSQQIVRYQEDTAVQFTGLVPACVQKLMSFGLSSDFFVDT